MIKHWEEDALSNKLESEKVGDICLNTTFAVLFASIFGHWSRNVKKCSVDNTENFLIHESPNFTPEQGFH